MKKYFILFILLVCMMQMPVFASDAEMIKEVTREDVLIEAEKFIGHIPYRYGSRTTETKYEKGMKLDCSAFVSFVLARTFEEEEVSHLTTASLCSHYNLKQISEDELQIGDIGLRFREGAENNHIGIYAGKDHDGNNLWVHCNSFKGNVTLDKANNDINVFYSIDNALAYVYLENSDQMIL